MATPVFFNWPLPQNALSRCCVSFHKRFTTPLTCDKWILCELMKRVAMLFAAVFVYPTLILLTLLGRCSRSNSFTIPNETINKVSTALEKHTGQFIINLSDIAPDFRFKVCPEIDNYYNAMTRARKVCQENHLNRLVVPRVKLLEVTCSEGKKTVVAEELRPYKFSTAQELLHEKHSEELVPVMTQLTTLFALCGFGAGLDRRNIPILENVEPKKVMVLLPDNSDPKQNSYTSIFGFTGLISVCTSTEQLKAVVAEAAKQGIPYDDNAKMEMKSKIRKIVLSEKISQFHTTHGITYQNPLKPIEVDFGKLNVNMKQKIGKVTLQKAIEDVVKEINAIIALKNGEYYRDIKIQELRSLYLPKSNPSIQPYVEAKKDNGSWFDYIVELLVKNGYLYSTTLYNDTYHIQA